MQFVHPSVKLETSPLVIQEYMRIIETAGRACWRSKGRGEDQVQKLLENPTFDPETYEGWRLFHPDHIGPGTFGRGDIHKARIRNATKVVNHQFIRGLIKVDHTSVIEHSAITVQIITDRAVSHQLVRHRIGSFSQESQRYVGYDNDNHIAFIIPEGSGLEPGYYSWDDGWHSGLEGEYKTHQSLSELLMDTIQPDGAQQASFMDISKWSEYGMPRSWVRAMHYAEKCYQELLESGSKKEDARAVLPNAARTVVFATFNIRQWRHVLKVRLHKSAQHDIRRIMGIILDRFMETPMAPLFEDIYDEQISRRTEQG